MACGFALASGAAFAGRESVKADTDGLVTGCKSAYLMDYDSGECVYSLNENERMPIASVCKVMTLSLCLEAVHGGKLNFDDIITVSENASSMGGSQVFLASGSEYKLSELVKSIIVCSANDSCVAVAEAVGGSESTFVAAMNKKAAELGCNDTLFANCTGLPKETQYSCAHDVALMFGNLLQYEEYFDFSKIWLEDFEHPDSRTTRITNTNKLIRRYPACDGGKTGFTNEAGFCLAATAKKDNLRFISVVLGGDTSANRFDSAARLFDYGFANYRNKVVLDQNVTLNDDFAVRGGKSKFVAVRPARNVYIFSKADEAPNVTYNVKAYDIKAPIAENQTVGKIEVYKDGVLCDEVDVVAAEAVEKAGFNDYLKYNAENWAI